MWVVDYIEADYYVFCFNIIIMKGKSMSLKHLENREFLQSKNAKLDELISEMDCPEEDHL